VIYEDQAVNDFKSLFMRIQGKRQKKKIVFPVACLKIIGSVGRLFFVKSHSYHSQTDYGTIGSKKEIRVGTKKKESVGLRSTSNSVA
jgi:hypothetical protein